jgi:hypothetical protein
MYGVYGFQFELPPKQHNICSQIQLLCLQAFSNVLKRLQLDPEEKLCAAADDANTSQNAYHPSNSVCNYAEHTFAPQESHLFCWIARARKK